MADRQSYPSPTAAQTRAGAGPFYGNGGVSPSQAFKDGSHVDVPQMQLNAELENINPDLQGNGHLHSEDHGHLDEQHHHIDTHDANTQLARDVMSLNHQLAAQPNPYQLMTGASHQGSGGLDAAAIAAAKQRSKVSRACDECRRKKASPESPSMSCLLVQ